MACVGFHISAWVPRQLAYRGFYQSAGAHINPTELFSDALSISTTRTHQDVRDYMPPRDYLPHFQLSLRPISIAVTTNGKYRHPSGSELGLNGVFGRKLSVFFMRGAWVCYWLMREPKALSHRLDTPNPHKQGHTQYSCPIHAQHTMMEIQMFPWHRPLDSNCPCCPQTPFHPDEEETICTSEHCNSQTVSETSEEENSCLHESCCSQISSQKSLFCSSNASITDSTSQSLEVDFGSDSSSMESVSSFNFDEYEESDTSSTLPSSSTHSNDDHYNGPNIYEVYIHGLLNTSLYSGGRLHPTLPTSDPEPPHRIEHLLNLEPTPRETTPHETNLAPSSPTS